MSSTVLSTAIPLPDLHRAGLRLSLGSIALVVLAHAVVLGLLVQSARLSVARVDPVIAVRLLAAPVPEKAEPLAPARPASPVNTHSQNKPVVKQLAARRAAPVEVQEPTKPAPLPAIDLPLSLSTKGQASPAPTLAPVAPPRFDADYLLNPAPVYPALARRLGEAGKVLLRVFVAADGRPTQIEIKQGSGSPRLDQAALDAVWRWRFVAARQGAEAVGAWVQVPIVFNLTN